MSTATTPSYVWKLVTVPPPALRRAVSSDEEIYADPGAWRRAREAFGGSIQARLMLALEALDSSPRHEMAVAIHAYLTLTDQQRAAARSLYFFHMIADHKADRGSTDRTLDLSMLEDGLLRAHAPAGEVRVLGLLPAIQALPVIRPARPVRRNKAATPPRIVSGPALDRRGGRNTVGAGSGRGIAR